MNVMTKFDLSNFLLLQTLKHPEEYSDVVLNDPQAKFLDTLFINLIKEQTSLYFYKCIDIIYVLQLLSDVRFIRTYNEFWYKIEDLILRMKRDLNIEKIIRLAEIYSSIGHGS